MKKNIYIALVLAIVLAFGAGCSPKSYEQTLAAFEEAAMDPLVLDQPGVYDGNGRIIEGNVHIVCGDVIEFSDEELENVQKRLESKYHYRIVDHRLDVNGYCPECQKTLEPDESPLEGEETSRQE